MVLTKITFITRKGFITQTLAYMLDSLVRVSRRVVWSHYVNILNEFNHVLTY